MATIIKTDGSKEELKNPSLDTLQKAVGGYIEAVMVGPRIMYVNEEGRIHDLPDNPAATALTRQPIVGDVVLLSEEETKADMGE